MTKTILTSSDLQSSKFPVNWTFGSEGKTQNVFFFFKMAAMAATLDF